MDQILISKIVFSNINKLFTLKTCWRYQITTKHLTLWKRNEIYYFGRKSVFYLIGRQFGLFFDVVSLKRQNLFIAIFLAAMNSRGVVVAEVVANVTHHANGDRNLK